MAVKKDGKKTGASKIRSPKSGYDFPEKQKYREDVWKEFSEFDWDEEGKFLIFPSTEGLEIETALSFGYEQKNLIAVDDDPKSIEESEWRSKYPDIKFYGGKLSECVKMMERDMVELRGANLDFCNNLSHDLIEEVRSFVCSDLWSYRCMVAFTVMNGREAKTTNDLANMLFSNMDTGIGRNYGSGFFGFENKRLTIVAGSVIPELNAMDKYLTFERDSSYMSGNIRMSYGFVGLRDSDANSDITYPLPQFEKNLSGIKSKARHIKWRWNTYAHSIDSCHRDNRLVIDYLSLRVLARGYKAAIDESGCLFRRMGFPTDKGMFVDSEFQCIINGSFFERMGKDFLDFVNRDIEFNDIATETISAIGVECINMKSYYGNV